MKNMPFTITYLINYMLIHSEFRYFLFTDARGFRSPRLDLLTGIVLRDNTMGKSDFDFPKKIRGKKDS